MSTDEEYAALLRERADAGVRGSHVSGEVALGSVRRGLRRRRARNAAVGAGLAATLVVGGAVGLPALDGAAPVAPTAPSSAASAPDLEPVDGVRLMDPRVRGVERADGLTVLDTGLDAWADGQRFLLVLHGSAGEAPARVDVHVGDDATFGALVDATTLPPPVWTTPDTSTAVLVSPDERHALVLGATQDDGVGDHALLLWDALGTDGAQERSLPVLLSGGEVEPEATAEGVTFAHAVLWALTVDAGTGTVPQPRGVLSDYQPVHPPTSTGLLDACDVAECVATWDGTGTATDGPVRFLAPRSVDDLPGHAEALAALVDVSPVATTAERRAACADAREAAEQAAGVGSSARDRATQCVADDLEAGLLASAGTGG